MLSCISVLVAGSSQSHIYLNLPTCCSLHVNFVNINSGVSFTCFIIDSMKNWIAPERKDKWNCLWSSLLKQPRAALYQLSLSSVPSASRNVLFLRLSPLALLISPILWDVTFPSKAHFLVYLVDLLLPCFFSINKFHFSKQNSHWLLNFFLVEMFALIAYCYTTILFMALSMWLILWLLYIVLAILKCWKGLIYKLYVRDAWWWNIDCYIFSVIRSYQVGLCPRTFWCWTGVASWYYFERPGDHIVNHWSNWSRFGLVPILICTLLT